MTDPMIDELLVIFQKLEPKQVLEILCVLFLELFDFRGKTIDSLDWRWLGLAELSQCLGPGWGWRSNGADGDARTYDGT